MLSIKDFYTDDAKIEAGADRYSLLGKALNTTRKKIKQQLGELWKYAQSVSAAEPEDTEPSGFDKIDAEKVNSTVDKINTALAGKPDVPKAVATMWSPCLPTPKTTTTSGALCCAEASKSNHYNRLACSTGTQPKEETCSLTQQNLYLHELCYG